MNKIKIKADDLKSRISLLLIILVSTLPLLLLSLSVELSTTNSFPRLANNDLHSKDLLQKVLTAPLRSALLCSIGLDNKLYQEENLGTTSAFQPLRKVDEKILIETFLKFQRLANNDLHSFRSVGLTTFITMTTITTIRAQNQSIIEKLKEMEDPELMPYLNYPSKVTLLTQEELSELAKKQPVLYANLKASIYKIEFSENGRRLLVISK